MQKYSITSYTRRKAKKHNVTVVPSVRKGKKIDVIKDGKRVASIGAYGMNDYPTYIKKRGLTYANSRRILYNIRHKKDRTKVNSNGWWAAKLLW